MAKKDIDREKCPIKSVIDWSDPAANEKRMSVPEGYKMCTVCGEVKELEDNFYKDGYSTDNKPKYRGECKECYRLKRRFWRKENKKNLAPVQRVELTKPDPVLGVPQKVAKKPDRKRKTRRKK